MKVLVARTTLPPSQAGHRSGTLVQGGHAFTSETTVRYRTDTAGTVPGHPVVAPPAPRVDESAQVVMDWLASDESRRYEGQWIALGQDGVVLAHADSPSQLPSDAVRQPGVTTLFVLPRDVRITG